MRYLLIALIFPFFFFSCEKRKCECAFDMTAYWEGETSSTQNVDYTIPNAVLSESHPYTIRLYDFVNTNNALEWDITSVRLYAGDEIYLDSVTDELKVENRYVQFPHDLFVNSKGEPVTGKVSLEMTLFFKTYNAQLHFEGSFFIYTCDDVQNDDFKKDDCIWSGQVLSSTTFNPSDVCN